MTQTVLAPSIMGKYTNQGICLMDEPLPPYLELILNQIGVLRPVSKEEPIRSELFTFRRPNFDENGEPDF